MSRLGSARRTPRVRPLRAGVALLLSAALALGLAGILLAVDQLRHPPPEDLPLVPPPDPADDPRAELVCPEPPEPAPDGEPIEVAASDLMDCPASYHARRVRYQGEAVVEVLRRGERAWLQLNDDVYAGALGPLPLHRDYRGANAGVGVLVPRAAAGQVETVGNPTQRGDVVEVVGEFRRVDSDRGEVLVILAEEATVVRRGRPLEDPLLPDRAWAAGVLGVLAAAAVAVERLLARRR